MCNCNGNCNVYVVTYYYQDDPEIVGVYTTRQKAEEAIVEDAEEYDRKGRIMHYSIKEMPKNVRLNLYV